NVYYIRKRGASVATVAANSLVLTLVVSLVLLVACLVGWPWIIAPFTKGARPAYVYLALSVVPFVLIESYFLAIMQAVENFRAYNLQSVYKAVFSFVGIAFAL